MEKKIKILEEALKLVESLPEGRRFFYNTGVLYVELTKEEAINILKDEIEKLKSNLNNNKEVKN